MLVTGIFDDSDQAEKVYRQVKGRRINELSFAFTVTESEYGEVDGQTVRYLKGVELHEVSVVPIGANNLAQISGVKSERRLPSHAKKSLNKIDELMGENPSGILDMQQSANRLRTLTELKSLVVDGEPDDIAATLAAFEKAESESVQAWLDERKVPQTSYSCTDFNTDEKSAPLKWFDAKATPQVEKFSSDMYDLKREELVQARDDLAAGIKSGDNSSLTAAAKLTAAERVLAQRSYAKAHFQHMEQLFAAPPV